MMISSTHEEEKNESKGLDKECSDNENKRKKKSKKLSSVKNHCNELFYYKAPRDKY